MDETPRQEESAIERLLKDPHILRAEPAEKWPSLEKIDSLVFAEGSIRDWINTLNPFEVTKTDFLDLPYIIDTFTSHIERSQWKHSEVKRKYGKEALIYLQQNALRQQNYMRVNALLMLNETNYRGTNPEEFRKQREGLEKSYQLVLVNSSDSTPIERVRELKTKTYDFLKFLSEQKPIDKNIELEK